MKLTVLGNCGPYPVVGGACSGYLLESANTRVLIDCGTGVLARLLEILRPDALDAVILSHLHFDHMSDLLPMIYALQFHPRKEPLRVFAPDAPADVSRLLNAPCYELNPMLDCSVGDICFRFFPGRHPVQSFAVRAEAEGRVFVYTGDTNETEGLAAFADSADLLLADAGLSEADWNPNAPHLSAMRCGTLARDAHARRLLLTHLNPRYSPDALTAEAKSVFAETAFAEPRFTCEI